MASTITPARAQSLNAAGYTIVGRYLTNEQATNFLDKKIKPGELEVIFGAGLRLFPIFEEGGYKASWFTAAQGTKDAQRAYDAAVTYGIPAGTTIYFAVDVDVVEDQVRSAVMPYFAALNTKMNNLGGAYGIGIYGSRNTCSIVSAAGLARTSYIAGLSTGFSGNLGYPLPSNWAFNQIQTLTIGSGSGAVEIDKNVVSGRDTGINAVNTSGKPLAQFFAYIDALQAYAQTWSSSGNATTTPDRLVLQYMRYPNYGSGVGDNNGIDAAEWAVIAGQLDLGFISFVDKTGLRRPQNYTEPSPRHIQMDPTHVAAAVDALLQHPLDSRDVNLGEGGGWAGDFVQFVGTWVAKGRQDIDQYTKENLFLKASSGFGPDDFFEDIDGWLIASTLRNQGGPANAVIRNFYSADGGYRSRLEDFLRQRFEGSDITAVRTLTQALVPALSSDYATFQTALYLKFAQSPYQYSSEEAGQFAKDFLQQYKTYLLV
ncbi:glycoside hydrolase domain-containing protein [Clavibacter sp. CFBP 8614]|uniref:glycoside hydrolase domain-containing protein n=1 Tax=unclassified Clavibacter TaxID=2626594 RepID=UPI0040438487